MTKRYCGMCETWTSRFTCKACGMPTDKAERDTCFFCDGDGFAPSGGNCERCGGSGKEARPSSTRKFVRVRETSDDGVS